MKTKKLEVSSMPLSFYGSLIINFSSSPFNPILKFVLSGSSFLINDFKKTLKIYYFYDFMKYFRCSCSYCELSVPRKLFSNEKIWFWRLRRTWKLCWQCKYLFFFFCSEVTLTTTNFLSVMWIYLQLSYAAEFQNCVDVFFNSLDLFFIYP